MTYEEIMKKVKAHHDYAQFTLGYDVAMTVLIGSQNYGLDDELSDIDTFSLIFPSREDIAFAREPRSGEVELKDGKCMYKDIRLALNLLKKTSPNSIELFTSNYIYYTEIYRQVLEKLQGENLHYIIHCNYSHMLYACAGMAHQLTKRNMPGGKRYAHALRLLQLVQKYIGRVDPSKLLILEGATLEEARRAKRDSELTEFYNAGCTNIANLLDKIKDEYSPTQEIKAIESKGLQIIEQVQLELMDLYFYYRSELVEN